MYLPIGPSNEQGSLREAQWPRRDQPWDGECGFVKQAHGNTVAQYRPEGRSQNCPASSPSVAKWARAEKDVLADPLAFRDSK